MAKKKKTIEEDLRESVYYMRSLIEASPEDNRQHRVTGGYP